ncbi:MAG: NBR1-Ig-like domain-containing protein, partial [Anaerolineales bacterium]
MDTGASKKTVPVSIFAFAGITIIIIFMWLLVTACGKTSTPFPTPTILPSLPPTKSPTVPPVVPTDTPVPTLAILFTPTVICINGLTFMSDVTIPDLSIVRAGNLLDKQWLVQNSGSCNWDSLYRVRLVGGDGLGASPEQALFPARAGMQATLRIVFTAPMNQGE